MADELAMLPIASAAFREFVANLPQEETPESVGLTLRARFPWTEGLVAWMTSTPEQIAAAELSEGVVEATRSLADLVHGPLAAGMREVYAAYYEVSASDVSRESLTAKLVYRGAAEAALREEIAKRQQSGDDLRLATLLRQTSRLLVHRGQLDEARRMHDQRLAILRRLGDLEGVAHALWDLAQLDLMAADMTPALARLQEAYSLLQGTGAGQGLAFVGTRYGELLAQTGDPKLAREVLETAREQWIKLGDARGLTRADALLAALEPT